jgi:hypothetical protein
VRLDRVYTQGEALVALKRLGFVVNEALMRPGLYEMSHPRVGGARTFTVDQLCAFAEGAAVLESLSTQGTPAA